MTLAKFALDVVRFEGFQWRKVRVQLTDFPLVVLGQRKVRVTLADFALDALKHVRDASAWRLAALRQKTLDFCEVLESVGARAAYARGLRFFLGRGAWMSGGSPSLVLRL